jgi:hypothetical protein
MVIISWWFLFICEMEIKGDSDRIRRTGRIRDIGGI